MTKSHSSAPPDELDLQSSRYELQGQLGRGGMASVFRAHDRKTDKTVALKLLSSRMAERAVVTTLFEREFHTLGQLKHPNVIEVYDYGSLKDGTPFYTMELLDGGDLRAIAPLPWRTACSLFYDVCSSLALLHSRRLLHRDISPPNIRCTQAGRAKLIDFGAMAPMSAGGADIVGTPAFVAPETLHRLSLDARTDLYSLGAALYYALTGNVPYPARTFADVMAAWGGKVRAPSAIEPSIPSALDDLVLSMISVEPALRPQSAFDVMQLLAAIAELQPSESEAVPHAYLSTPALVGREGALDEFRHHLLASRLSRGRALLWQGPAGVGRSRMLDACCLEARTLGFNVLQTQASAGMSSFGTVEQLVQQLVAAAPAETSAPAAAATEQPATTVLATPPAPPDFSDPARSSEELQRECVRFFWGHSAQRPLLLAIDDVHAIDPRSAAVVAALLDKSARGRVFAVLSADAAASDSYGLAALTRRCNVLPVEPLTKKHTRTLFSSLFGEVANLDLLAQEVYAVSAGVPQHCMDVAQHLVDRGLIRYAAGSWTLPSRLSPSDLPQSAADAISARVARLSADARLLAEALALAFTERLNEAQCQLLLSAAKVSEPDSALTELIAGGVVLRQGSEYALPNRLWIDVLTRPLAAHGGQDAQLRQRALAELYRAHNQVAFIYHAFAGELDEEGLTALAELNAGYAQRLDQGQIFEANVAKMMACYPRAFAAAARLGKSPRFVNELRRWRFAGTTLEEDAHLPESSQAFLAQLRHDSGLDLYQSDPDTSDPMPRLMRALTAAQERYLATPEALRVYNVEEAIRLLAEYVVIAIAYAGRAHDAALMRSLPPLIEPFAPLSPVLDAIWNNAVAAGFAQCEGQYGLARERWLEVIQKLDALKGNEMPYVEAIANAVAFAIGLMEAQLGMPSGNRWAERLDRDPSQHVAALQLRRIVRLQQGDTRGAERFRRQVELQSLSSRIPQMFKSLLTVELTACANARDLAGIQDVIERMRPVAERFVHWQPNLLYAEACFHLARGDYAAARAKCEASLRLSAPDANGESSSMMIWTGASVCLAEVMLASDQADKAREVLQRVEDTCAAQGRQARSEVTRVLAMVEAKLGDAAGVPRLAALIARQLELGVSGVRLGLSYEARAQIAIWQADAEAFEQFAGLTAHEYRYGADSALGARYDRLINEARRQGLQTSATLEHFATQAEPGSTVFTDEVHSSVQRSMKQERSPEGRALAALQLICAARKVSDGQLYLRGPQGLVLAATQGNAPAFADLSAIEAFLEQAEEHDNQLEELSTDRIGAVGEVVRSTVRAGATDLELLALSTVVDGQALFAGVVAVAVGDLDVNAARERRLLGEVAAHLVSKEPKR